MHHLDQDPGTSPDQFLQHIVCSSFSNMLYLELNYRTHIIKIIYCTISVYDKIFSNMTLYTNAALSIPWVDQTAL